MFAIRNSSRSRRSFPNFSTPVHNYVVRFIRVLLPVVKVRLTHLLLKSGASKHFIKATEIDYELIGLSVGLVPLVRPALLLFTRLMYIYALVPICYSFYHLDKTRYLLWRYVFNYVSHYNNIVKWNASISILLLMSIAYISCCSCIPSSCVDLCSVLFFFISVSVLRPTTWLK